MLRRAVLISALLAAAGCDTAREPITTAQIEDNTNAADDPAAQCTSRVVIEKLRDSVFDAAVAKVTDDEAVKLNSLRAAIAGRMESPVVNTHDEGLQRTECAGRLVFGLPPNTQAAFGGAAQLSADINYGVQPAADRSGLVVQATGSGALVTSLVNGAQHKRLVKATPPPLPRLDPGLSPLPPLIEVPSPSARSSTSRPSFRCSGNLSAVERSICDDPGLSAQDATMAETWAGAKARTPADARPELDALRQKYLGRRNRCDDASCLMDVYDDWISALADWNP